MTDGDWRSWPKRQAGARPYWKLCQKMGLSSHSGAIVCLSKVCKPCRYINTNRYCILVREDFPGNMAMLRHDGADGTMVWGDQGPTHEENLGSISVTQALVAWDTLERSLISSLFLMWIWSCTQKNCRKGSFTNSKRAHPPGAWGCQHFCSRSVVPTTVCQSRKRAWGLINIFAHPRSAFLMKQGQSPVSQRQLEMLCAITY